MRSPTEKSRSSTCHSTHCLWSNHLITPVWGHPAHTFDWLLVSSFRLRCWSWASIQRWNWLWTFSLESCFVSNLPKIYSMKAMSLPTIKVWFSPFLFWALTLQCWVNHLFVPSVEQLIKNTSQNNRLDIKIQNKKKETYVFESVRERENFCQLMQQLKNMHSIAQEVENLSLFVGTWNMGEEPVQFYLDCSKCTCKCCVFSVFH